MTETVVKSFVEHPDQTVMFLAFCMLIAVVMWQNEKREKRYQKTIDGLTEALAEMRYVRKDVEKLSEKIDRGGQK